jgi:hypothetical protein
MDVVGFGFNGHRLFPEDQHTTVSQSPMIVNTPQYITHADVVKILWASWCDAISRSPFLPLAWFTSASLAELIEKRREKLTNTGLVCFEHAHESLGRAAETVAYYGTSLTNSQIKKVKEIPSQGDTVFFGSVMHDGLRGVIKKSSPSYVTFLTSDESKPRSPDNEFEYHVKIPEPALIEHVVANSGGQVSIIAVPGRNTGSSPDTEPRGSIMQFQNLASFRDWLTIEQSQIPPDLTDSPRTQNWKLLVSNAVSCTALTTDGRVFTWGTDARYPECFGRDANNDANVPTQVPYLSETKIVKVVSGGYMTAAVSEEGELFLWGRSPPGAEGELCVLRGKKAGLESEDGDAEYEDELVKCVEVGMISDRAVQVTDVAVGNGHVLYAAECLDACGSCLERSVWAAGQGEYGQLGLGTMEKFVDEFKEVVWFQGKRVKSLTAVGWSSWVIVEDS